MIGELETYFVDNSQVGLNFWESNSFRQRWVPPRFDCNITTMSPRHLTKLPKMTHLKNEPQSPSVCYLAYGYVAGLLFQLWRSSSRSGAHKKSSKVFLRYKDASRDIRNECSLDVSIPEGQTIRVLRHLKISNILDLHVWPGNRFIIFFLMSFTINFPPRYWKLFTHPRTVPL